MDAVPGLLQQANNKISTISRLTGLIATPNDSQDVRQQLFSARQQCIEILKDCDRIINSSPNSPQHHSLSDELRKVCLR